MHQTLNQNWATMTLKRKPMRSIIASLIRTIHWINLKHLQNGNSKNIFTLLLADHQQGKFHEDTIWAVMDKEYLPTLPVLVHLMEFCCKAQQGIVEVAHSRLCKASWQQWRKWIGTALQLSWSGKGNRAELSSMKCTCLTGRLLLSHRKLRGFQVHERVLTLPALSVWTSTGMTKKTWWTSRETFKEEQGVCKGPCVIKYISVLTLTGSLVHRHACLQTCMSLN